MTYNFVKQLYRGEFSFAKDVEQTVQDFNRIGLEKILVDIPERVLGKIKNPMNVNY